MESTTSKVLELDKVLSHIAGFTESIAAADLVRSLAPLPGREVIERERDLVSEARGLLGEHSTVPPLSLPEKSLVFEKLALGNVLLREADLTALSTMAKNYLLLKRIICAKGSALPGLRRIVDRAGPSPDMIRSIERAIDPEFGIKENASPLLTRLTRDLRKVRDRIVRSLENMSRTIDSSGTSPDASVTIRNGRYVLPVRVDVRSRVSGIIHDKSRTGQTIFIEPQSIVDDNNELRETEIEIEREKTRILQSLSDLVSSQAPQFQEAFRSMAQLDSLLARARCATEWDCTSPVIDSGNRLRIVGGRHPVLLMRLRADDDEENLVELDLEFHESERTLLVSGPNAGGKTVMLKTIGLLVLMALCGLHIPAHSGTVIPYPNGLFVDIGDEQSIEHDLSTFSSHLVRLAAILRRSGENSLVLLDEIGVGTDPVEGIALARALLEELNKRSSRTIATTHYSQLKGLAREGNGFVNGSLSFDSEKLEPTFVFSKGLPGRSMGLAVARRTGLPEDVVERAKSYLDDEGVALEELLGELDALKRSLSEKMRDVEARETYFERASRELKEKTRHYEEKLSELEQNLHEETRRAYLSARRELEEAIEEVRKTRARDDVVHEARKVLDEGLRRHVPKDGERPSRGTEFVPEPGSYVRLIDMAIIGRVSEVFTDRDEVDVEVSGKLLRIPLDRIEKVQDSGGDRHVNESSRRGASLITMDVDDSTDSLDLRGCRRDEVFFELARGIDTALINGLSVIRVIHGKGTGALRDEVQQFIRQEKRVKNFRMGRPWEGGSGVTVIEV